MLIVHPTPGIQLFQILTFKIQGQGYSSRSHSGFNILSTHIPFVLCQLTLPFLRCSFCKIWPLKSKVKVMDEVNIPSHKVALTSYPLKSPSFYVNRSSHSWDMAFSKFGLEIQSQGHISRSHSGCNILLTHISISMLIDPTIPEIHLYLNNFHGQDHERIQSSKPQSVFHFLLIHILFILCQSSKKNRPSHYCDTAFFNIWKSKVKFISPWCSQLQV